MTWLRQLPDALRELERRWFLVLEAPFDGEEGGGAWVAPAKLPDGRWVVLKLGMPHMEAEDEAEGLRFWDGDPTVRLLDADDALGAMLLERCQPGTSLRSLPEPEQDAIVAGLLRRMWKRVPTKHLGPLSFRPLSFRPLSRMLHSWSQETLAARANWLDAGLVEAGLRLFETLPGSALREVLLATDLHAGNVLGAEREPWLVIDPKPFLGDPAYDATQHLLNCAGRLEADPDGLIRRFADMLETEEQRVRWWMFARTAAEPRAEWNDYRTHIARQIAP